MVDMFTEVLMHIVLVHVHVKPEHVEAFKAATIRNASQSIEENGISRFDVIQQKDDSTRFVLVEVYRSVEATTFHKQTEHYMLWKESVEALLAEPRVRFEYSNIFPNDAGWS